MSRWSRSAQLAELRQAIQKLQDDLEAKGQELLDKQSSREELSKAGEEPPATEDDGDAEDDAGGFVRFGPDFPGKALISEEDLADVDRGLVSILNGDLRLWLWCPEATDVVHGITWAKEHGLADQVVYLVSAAAFKAADRLAASGRPVVLAGSLWHVEDDPVTGEEQRTFAPKAFLEAGVAVAIGSVKSRLGPDRLAYQAATCVREGMSRAAALAAVTTTAARAWGLEQRMGKIAADFDGSFVLLSGDPLDLRSKVLEVWVRGRSVYQREHDERLQRLLKGEAE